VATEPCDAILSAALTVAIAAARPASANTGVIVASAGSETGLIKVGDASIQYLRQEQGEAVVLLPGGSSAFVRRQIAAQGISKRGDKYLRTLLIHGARHALPVERCGALSERPGL
jgi:hypothetical protein